MSRPLKGEWVWHFSVAPDFRYAGRGWRIFMLVFGKMRHDMPEGHAVRQRDVWGISINFCFWWPIERL